MLKKLISLLLFIPSLLFAAAFSEGKDYQLVSGVQLSTTKNNKMPVVTEFFSYGCPWCYRIEAPFKEWTQANSGVAVNRVPVVFKPEWELYAKAYYTAKTLAMVDKLNPLLFKTIQDEKKLLDSKQAMIDFFVAQGVDREIAQSAFERSPTIDMQVKNGMALMAQYHINAVPAFVINNKYKTDLQMAGSPERLFEIMNFLSRKS